MQTIHKFALDVPTAGTTLTLTMPMGAKVLSIQTLTDNRWPYVWALVDKAKPTAQRLFRILATGMDIQPNWAMGQYVGTFQTLDDVSGTLVFHVFDRGDQ
jgi:hypothetical protein